MTLLPKPADIIDTPTTACARYGTGDFLKLNKRECSTTIELSPVGTDFLRIVWNIGKDRHMFRASSAVGSQFASFLQALYTLYSEGADNHDHFYTRWVEKRFFFPAEDDSLSEDEVRIVTQFGWDGEGPWYTIVFNRRCKGWIHPVSDGEDPVEVTITIHNDEETIYSYVVDGRDLCYAASKAATEVLKKFGFFGYFSSTGGDCNGFGDILDIHVLLFLKAYALNALEVRELTTIWKPENSWRHAEGTSFQKELELLLFDM